MFGETITLLLLIIKVDVIVYNLTVIS